VATVAVLAGIGGFAIWRALESPAGPASPDEAASRFFESAESEDLLGIVELMLPSERQSMIEPLTDIAIELVRLDQLSDDVVDDGRLAGVSGVTVDFHDEGQLGQLVYEVAPLGGSETVHWVTVTGGMATVTFDPVVARDNLGQTLLDWFGAEIDDTDLEVQTEVVDLAEASAAGQPLEFAVVEEGGAWYVSLWYTVAAQGSGGSGPDPLAAPTPNGGATAESAAADFVRSAVELDLARSVTLLDPEEFRALYDYWGHFGPDLVDEAGAARGDAAAEGVSWTVESITTSAEERNGRTVATVDGMAVRFTSEAVGAEADVVVGLDSDGLSIDGTLLGQPLTVSVDGERAMGRGVIEGDAFEFDLDLRTYEGYAQIGPDLIELARDGECLVVTAAGERQRICDDDLGLSGSSAALDIQEDWEAILADAGTPGLTMVERDGRWYVSGAPTVLHGINDFLVAVDRERLEELIDSYGELVEGFGQGPF
jgi:hypothetical protein